MKKLNLRGVGKVFRFTLARHTSQKSYIALTVIVAILLFGLVFALTLFPNLPDDDAIIDGDIVYPTLVLLCDATDPDGDGKWIDASLGDIPYRVVADVNTALAQADPYTVIVAIDGNGQDSFEITLLTTDDTALTYDAIDEIAFYARHSFNRELYRRSGIQIDSDYSVYTDLPYQLPPEDAETDEFDEGLREIIEMSVSVIVIFVMYFMVLMYGQTAAGSVMLEKTSKLMDFFLVSVSTPALMLGKVLAVSCAAIIQVTAWIVSAGGGWWIGSAILRAIVPDVEGGVLSGLFAQLEGLFSPLGVIIALLCIVFGFILYCGLAAVGGALASKQEDLSSTNGIFTMALVISYLLALFSGTGIVSTAPWLIYFPFTAILVTPGRAITGSISPVEGLISVVLVALTAFVVILLSGKIYTMMAFYRGNPPKLSDLPRLFKKNNS